METTPVVNTRSVIDLEGLEPSTDVLTQAGLPLKRTANFDQIFR